MRLLVLGGTGFVGRAVVEVAVARGHQVTVLNRGHRSPPGGGVRVLTGDRRRGDGLAALAGGAWDAVVDTWSGAPAVVRDAARALRGHAGHYTYVSSRSVYRPDAVAPFTEDSPVVDGSADAGDDVDYAALKRGGELGAQEFGAAVLLARPGLILGPYEDIGRLPWWLRRLAAGGPTLAPGPQELPLQYVDARDLAAFVLDAAVDGRAGAYDVVSPSGHTTMGELLRTANAVTGGRAELRWTDPEVILAAGIEPWTQLPVWLPPGELHTMLHGSDVRRALAAGLRVRPVAETVADTWAWLQTVDGPAPQRPDRPAVGLDPAVEAAVLAG
ncbi:NAD-dependent epimerase/dehydratase family protein [Krasilnikovia sp. MM14-A1004]|uniref:NAD-dependent epimerase/dehydratase family protein n=1 Tax=Krasilnikovia sp. MM14-A1004 TaxID=3373541 RepID=UPI00399C8F1B